MGVYIDRKQALSHPFANGKYDHDNANEHFILGLESYREWLEQLPTIDLVRCGECKHSKEWYGDHRLCYLWSEAGIGVFEDGFCSYGERRTDDSNTNR